MNIGIIFAGGVGRRMRTNGIPKQFLKINDVPIIIHTLNVFEKCEEIDAIVVACVESHIEYLKELVKKYKLNKVKDIVIGGETGQLSIYNALKAAKKLSKSNKDIVLINDGVRPIIDSDLLKRNIESVKKYGNAVSSVAQKETTVISEDNETISEITDRSKTYIARAPQSFYLDKILEAEEKAIAEGKNNVIDSSSLMHSYGEKIHLVECNSNNIKITEPVDYYIAKAILKLNETREVLGDEE